MKHVCIILILCFFAISCKKENPEIEEIVVIGGGLMGSSTAWQLSRQGNSVLLIEKQDSIYHQGSSFGEARIARSNNRGNDIWSYLHNNSVEETQYLIDFLNISIDSEKYQMSDIYTTSPVTYVGRTSIYEKLYASLIRQKVDYAIAINPEEGKSKFNVILPDSVLIQREFNKYSGTLNPHELISYLHQGVRQKGNTIKYNTEVIDINFKKENNFYELKVKSDKSGEVNLIRSRKVVAAAGPYNGELLSSIAPYFKSLINPQRVFLAFIKISKDKYEELTKEQQEKLFTFYPVINSSKGTRDGSFFSMIEYLDKDSIPVIKIGGHFQRSNIENLDTVWEKSLSESEIMWSMTNTAQYLKLLNLPVEQADLNFIKGYSCVYSLTESEVPFVTPIMSEDDSPNDRFVVLGGMSGVGAKGAMTYGLIAANILNEKNVNDSVYNTVKKELGFGRLVSDLKK